MGMVADLPPSSGLLAVAPSSVLPGIMLRGLNQMTSCRGLGFLTSQIGYS